MDVLREMPEAKCEFLRFQVGEMVTRAALKPIYEGRKFVGHSVTDERISVFRLRGWGSTLAKAERMAKGLLR